ncbi:alpha/beta hydrolase [candidate division KSB1 bacterium]
MISGQNIWHIFWTFLLTLSGLYLIILIILTVFQSKFIYFPQSQISATPDFIGIEYEQIEFKATDGVNLSGWFVPANNHRGIILFCHGNAGNISHRLESIKIFFELGLSVFIFDYRGYGQSEGNPSETGTYLDAEGAWKYLIQVKNIKSDEIVIFGRSLGASIAAWTAQKYNPKALIIESAFTSVPGLGSKIYPFLPVKLLSRFKYSTIDYIRDISCPLLIVHSRNDDLIPYEHGIKLFETAHEPKDFLEISGTHNEGFLMSEALYKKGINSFLSKYFEK